MYFLASFIFVVMVFNFILALINAGSAQKKVVALQAGIVEKRKAFGIQELEKQWGAYRWKLSAVDSMMKARSLWGNRLKEFSNSLPDGMFISEITIVEEKGKQNCLLEIMALQDETKGFKQIDSFINAIETNKFFGKGVKLQSHERKRVNGRDVELFRLTLAAPNKGSAGGFNPSGKN